ncbi:MAG: hypothetical protein CUN55_18590, partial [Phototrophicales bacterium]
QFSNRDLMYCLYEWNDPRENAVSTSYGKEIRKQNQEDISETSPPQLFLSIVDALERKGQVILHGPPGTGKTYHALRFAKWWLGRTQDELTTRQTSRRVWWMVANPKQWHWEELFNTGSVTYKYGRLQRNYVLVQPDDLVIGYLSTPHKHIYALARVT